MLRIANGAAPGSTPARQQSELGGSGAEAAVRVDARALADVGHELAPLTGARVQRVDVVADRELVIELRVPGRTVRLLACYRAGSERVHVVEARPPRLVDGGDLQRALRKRLEGQVLVGIGVEGHNLALDVEGARIEVRLQDHALVFLPPSGKPAAAMPDPDAVPSRFPCSEALAARFGTSSEGDALRALRTELNRTLETRRRKLEKLRVNLEQDLERLEAMARHRRHGELLKTVFHQLARGQREAKVFDHETGTEVLVPLDPAIGPKENMERLFNLARKGDRGRPLVARRRAEVAAELEALAADRVAVAEAGDLAALAVLAARVRPASGRAAAPGARRADPDPATLPPNRKKPIDRCSRRFTAGDGSEVRVGRGANENDRLTFSFARGDDVWLHASGTSGAHVILRVEKGRTPTPEALEDAALLAAHYSGARARTEVEVTYAEARYVKKMKGDSPGRVSVARARTLRVVIDEARLARLFGRTPH